MQLLLVAHKQTASGLLTAVQRRHLGVRGEVRVLFLGRLTDGGQIQVHRYGEGAPTLPGAAAKVVMEALLRGIWGGVPARKTVVHHVMIHLFFSLPRLCM